MDGYQFAAAIVQSVVSLAWPAAFIGACAIQKKMRTFMQLKLPYNSRRSFCLITRRPLCSGPNSSESTWFRRWRLTSAVLVVGI